MRDDLKGIAESDYWVYGLDESDFDYTLNIAENFISARKERLQNYARQLKEEQDDAADEILDDVSYYAFVEEQYLWQFCLWRIQAIIEGLIVYTFLKGAILKSMIGLKTKLEAIRDAGYTLDDPEYNELLDWASLRNTLSHAPPEQYRPGPLKQSDVLEYKEFVEGLCSRWRDELLIRTGQSV